MHDVMTFYKNIRCGIYVFAFVLCSTLALTASADVVRTITFPVNGEFVYRNDFHEPRGGGTRLHQGNDIIAPKMTPLVSVVDGYVNYVARPQASWGYEIEIQDDEGYTYDYLHINNDTPGTDDGIGGEANAYIPGLVRGARVSRGQLIGWVGDSGNSEDTVPHLHFEMHDPNHVTINPFESLFLASGGKGVSNSAPRPTTVEVSWDERKAQLRYIFTKDLSYGLTSSEVRQLQLVLKALGHFSHPSATGYFGDVTKASVLSFQAKKNLPGTGTVDLATRRKLNDDLGTYDPNDYQPFYSAAESRAIEIQKLLALIAKLQAQLKQIRGY